MKNKTLTVLFLVFQCTFAMAGQEAAKGRITGRMLIKEGVPMSKGYVYFYAGEPGRPPTVEQYGRVPEYATELDEDGRFMLELPAGGYYIEGIKSKEERPGPPQEGDYHIIAKDKNGAPALFAVKDGQTTNTGTIFGAGLYKRPAGHNKDYNITGFVLTGDGAPVSGAIVFAYKNAEMRGKPVFVSDKTGKDGRYVLKVEEDMPVYLSAREIYSAGRPKNGDSVGVYGETGPVPVVVTKGETAKEINIKVKKITIPE